LRVLNDFETKKRYQPRKGHAVYDMRRRKGQMEVSTMKKNRTETIRNESFLEGSLFETVWRLKLSESHRIESSVLGGFSKDRIVTEEKKDGDRKE
jgi:hypothetical protein